MKKFKHSVSKPVTQYQKQILLQFCKLHLLVHVQLTNVIYEFTAYIKLLQC